MAALIALSVVTGRIVVVKEFVTSQWIAFILWVFALQRATPTRVANTMTVNSVAAGLLATQLVGGADWG